MENNRYAQHKQEIKEISEREGVDIGVACAMLRDKMGWTFEETKGVDRELTEFTSYINELSRKSDSRHNLVAEYFAD